MKVISKFQNPSYLKPTVSTFSPFQVMLDSYRALNLVTC